MLRKRTIARKIREFATQYPVVTVTGPRQSGKTTLCRELFPKKPYINLELADMREWATSDPRDFLREFPQGAVLDEVQKAPEILSYIQDNVDSMPSAGKFILTGSQNLLLMQGVSQSLTGRTALATLLPFTLDECYGKKSYPDLMTVLQTGFYPRIHAQALAPSEAMGFYISTYVERDVRSLLQVKDALRFMTFLRLCAGRTGQILNYSTLASDAGISVNTAKEWISILEMSYIVKRLPPYFVNINKQISKTPKLYFLDTGVVCHLLGIHSPEDLRHSPARGAVFETYVVVEQWKATYNQCRPESLFYYRDKSGIEIDLVEKQNDRLSLTEIKSGMTVGGDWFKSLFFGREKFPNVTSLHVVYGGDDLHRRQGVNIRSWNKPYPINTA